MKKGLIALILSLSLLSIGKVLVNPSESKESIKKISEKELNKQLIQAVKIRDIKSIKALISKGADVNTSIIDGLLKGFTPLMFACLNENKEIVDLLISNGANIDLSVTEGGLKGFNPLMFACEKGYKDIVELLVSKGANVNVVATQGDYKGYTPLIFACKNGNKDIVELLVSKGADLKAFILEGDYKGYTPLMFAVQSENKDIERLLIKLSSNDSISYLEKKKDLLEYNIIKENMSVIQALSETYAFDWDDKYPEKLEELEKEAKSKGYWKDIKNPFTSKSVLGKDGAIMDYKIYKNYKPHPSLKGLVLYEAIDSKFDKVEKKSFSTKYKLYGTDENGELLKDKDGKVFILTNF